MYAPKIRKRDLLLSKIENTRNSNIDNPNIANLCLTTGFSKRHAEFRRTDTNFLQNFEKNVVDCINLVKYAILVPTLQQTRF